MQNFSDLPISSYVKERLSFARFSTPTPVQAAVIPQALERKDVLATAQTGTGKTLAFLVPVMERLLERTAPGIAALVLVPTRELADRKSTRLNSSHLVISYAVFCLKKKKIKTVIDFRRVTFY